MPFIKSLSIILLLALISNIGYTQSTQRSHLSNYDIEFFGLDNGLPAREIERICIDQNSLLWLLTPQSLFFYRGADFEQFNINERCHYKGDIGVFSDIINTTDGNLWLSSNQGLFVLNPQRNKVLPAQSIGLPDSIAHIPNLHFDLQRNGDIYIYAQPNVYLFHPATKILDKIAHTPLPVNYNVRRIIYSRQDDILYLKGAYYTPAYILRHKYLESLDTIYNYKETTLIDGVELGILKTPQDSVILFAKAKENVLDNLVFQKKQLALNHTLVSSTFTEWSAILQYFKEVLSNNITYSTPDRTMLYDIIADHNAALWINTDIGLVHIKKKTPLPFNTLEPFNGKNIRGIFEAQDHRILVSASQNLYAYDTQTGAANYVHVSPTVWDMTDSKDGNLWVLKEMPAGFSRVNINKLEDLPVDNARNNSLWCYKMAETFDNNVWVASTPNEVNLYERPSGRLLRTFRPELDRVFPQIQIREIHYTHDHSLWFAGHGGICRYKYIDTPNPVLDTSSIPTNVRKLPINTVYEDQQGSLWLGTKGWGIYHFNPNNKSIKHYSVNDGLSHNIVYSIIGSHHDSLIWIGTQDGLSCLVTNSDEFYNYTQNDGLAQDEFNSGSSYLAQNGVLYMGGVYGVTSFMPFIPAKRQVKLQCYAEVNISNTNPKNNQHFFPADNDIIQIYSDNLYIDILLHNSELFASHKHTYRYKLLPESKDWIYLDKSSKITFINLRSGTYTLVMQALAPSGEWSTPFNLVLQVNPPFYKTWWFFALVIILTGLSTYIASRIRIARLQREYTLREKISNDLHDSLGGRLYVLKTMAAQISNTQYSPEEKKDLLHQFDTLCKDAIQTIRDFIWAFNPKNGHLLDLVERMEDFADNAIVPIIDNVNFTADESQLHYQITPSIAHNYLMIYQEVLTNMIKHTHSQSISIDIQYTHFILKINIKNEHSGYKKENASFEGQGIQSINRRIAITNAQFNWYETPNHQHAEILIHSI